MANYYDNADMTKNVAVPNEISELTELLAEHIHNVWSQNRVNDGWKYGAERNDEKLETPCLVPYNELSESEKFYDKATSMETIKFILLNGYEIVKK